jgi:uncharacterized protein (TIGR03086 family)
MVCMTDMSPLARLDRAASAAAQVLDGVKADQLDASSPCTDWSVRQVINHVISGNLFFVHSLETGTFDRGSFDRTRDFVGDDPPGALRGSVAKLRELFSAPGALERIVPTPFGQQPAEVLLEMRVSEMMMHGWDVAKATGQSTDLDPELAESVLVRYRALRARGQGGDVFGPEQPTPEGATASDRLAAASGRTV